MTKLFLHGLHQDPYIANVACAYVYYGSKDNPLNHKQHNIGMFSGDQKEALEFVQHLENKVIPFLNQGLSKKSYQAFEVEYVNNAPHPVIAIRRKDKALLADTDLKTLEKLINDTINQHEHQLHFFKAKSPIKSDEDKPKHHYPLRSLGK